MTASGVQDPATEVAPVPAGSTPARDPIVVLIHGTWGRAQPWHRNGSPLRSELSHRGVPVYDFLWSGILAGVPTEMPGDPAEADVGGDDGRLLPWLDAGEKLCQFLYGIAERTSEISLTQPSETGLRLLTHSHGLQVGTFAVAKGFWPVHTFVSVSGPIRRDMQRARRRAMGSIRNWIQMADPDILIDPTLRLGELGGGGEPFTITLPEGTTIPTPGTGHHGLLVDPQFRSKYGLLDLLLAP